jgi:hypothetical protein
MSGAKRIAMWSGPRNISTAMMRSWEARGDTFVCDEPLYAHYLKRTRVPHPGAAEIIEKCETDWQVVVEQLTGPTPGGKNVFYQKHMAHHLLDHIKLDWIAKLTNCFLIRDPREMLISLAKVIARPTVHQTGLPQQVKLYGYVVAGGQTSPPVLDARDVLMEPAKVLRRLCERVGVPYTDRMLSWHPGPRETDGMWAKHWYDAVEKSTSFGSYTPQIEKLPRELEGVHKECLPLYQALWKHRIQA